MWSFANTHDGLFFVLALLALIVTWSVGNSFAKALATWGTKHCGTCACHSETGDSDDSIKAE